MTEVTGEQTSPESEENKAPEERDKIWALLYLRQMCLDTRIK